MAVVRKCNCSYLIDVQFCVCICLYEASSPGSSQFFNIARWKFENQKEPGDKASLYVDVYVITTVILAVL